MNQQTTVTDCLMTHRILLLTSCPCADQYPIEVSATAALLNGGVDAEMIIRAPFVSSAGIISTFSHFLNINSWLVAEYQARSQPQPLV